MSSSSVSLARWPWTGMPMDEGFHPLVSIRCRVPVKESLSSDCGEKRRGGFPV
jgi:hypothetical protein